MQLVILTIILSAIMHLYAREENTYCAYSFCRNRSGNLGGRFRWR